MPTAREIKNRIRSIKNIGQITRALEAEAASKVRRAQARVLASRAYAEKAWEILLNVQNSAGKGTPLHPLLTARPEIKNVLVIVVTSDRGLAGAYSTNIVRTVDRFVERLNLPTRFVAVGKKGRDSLVRAGENLMAEFRNPANPTATFVHPIAQLAIDEFLSGRVDEVFIAYTDFINTLTQRPVVLPLLPLIPFETNDEIVANYLKQTPSVTEGKLSYEYEPGAAAILEEIVPRFTELQLYQGILESQASEHSARMVAMRNASDNAKSLTGELTLAYNKARQAGITAEILDIVGGAEALASAIEAMADNILKHAEPARPQQPTVVPLAPSPAPTRKPSRKQETIGDDLTIIEGIGPKISTALKTAGIDTFAKLAAASDEQLREALAQAKVSLAPTLSTWAEQARFLVNGDEAGLKAFQETLSRRN